MADKCAKEAAGDQQHSVSDELRWEASLSHLTRVTTENRSRATSSGSRLTSGRSVGIDPLGLGFPKEGATPGKEVAITNLHSECRWCGSGKRESRYYHLFVECKAGHRRSGGYGRGLAKDCGWKRPKAPAVRKLWKEGATEAVLELLGCWSSAGAARSPSEAEGGGKVSDGEEDGPGSP